MRTVAATLALILTTLPVSGAETLFPAAGSETARLVIEGTTDLAIFAPIALGFQQTRPDVSISYDEITTNELNARVAAACDTATFVADLVISSSIDQQVKLVNDGCARSPGPETGAALPDWAKWRDELFGLTFEPAVIVYNRAWFADREVPRSRFDLIDLLRGSEAPRVKIGTYDIDASGVGYLLAFQDAAQATTWGRLVESFGRNAAQLFCCTADILDRVADGRLLVGYNVLGSYALSRMDLDPRIGIVLPSDYTLILARAGFISRDARQPELARAFITFMLSAAGRSILSGDARLLSPIDGPDQLAQIMDLSDADPQSLRPITFSPALLVGLDAAKRRIFLGQWRAALPNPGATDGD